jgi:hypothetical protein
MIIVSCEREGACIRHEHDVHVMAASCLSIQNMLHVQPVTWLLVM